MEPDPPRAITHGSRIVSQQRLKAFPARLIKPLVEIAIHKLDQFTAFLRLLWGNEVHAGKSFRRFEMQLWREVRIRSSRL